MTDIIPNAWADESNAVIGYMCLTDWECELGMASGGNVIYPSVDNIEEHRRCVAGCGIVEVEVRFRRVVKEAARDE